MKTSLSGHFTKTILLISVPAVILVFTVWIAGELLDFRKDADKLKNEYTLSQKNKIQTEVNRVIDYIQSKREATRVQLKTTLKEAVYTAHAKIRKKLNDNRLPTEEQLRKQIVSILNSQSISVEESNFFLISTEDNSYVMGANDELRNKDLSKHENGVAGIYSEIKELAVQNNEGFLEYKLAQRKSRSDTLNMKISFIKRIEGTKFILGASQYLDKYIGQEKTAFIEWIKHVRFDNGQGYIFLDDFNGYSIFNIHSDLIGKDLNYLRDENGVMITEEERRAAEKPDGDFIYYSWRRAPGLPLSPKVSFVRGIKEYSWMIGAGVYLDDIESVIEQNKLELRRAIVNRLFTIVVLLLIIVSITILIGRVFTKKLDINFGVFREFFKNASKHHERIDPDKLQFIDFFLLAEYANDMIDERERIMNDLEKNRARLHFALEASKETIWEWNTLTNDLYRSSRFFKLMNRDANPEGETGKFREWYEEIAEEDKPIVAEIIEEFLDGKSEYLQFEFRVANNVGKAVWFQSVGKATEIDPSGKPLRAIGTISDITERKNYEQKIISLNEILEFRVSERTAQLEDAMEELKYENDERKRTQLELYKAKDDLSEALKREKELSQMKSSFISMISHEYRTPMTVISLSAALLKKYNEVGDKANFNLSLGKIESSIQTMNHLIDDVLLFGKSESGRLTASVRDFRLDELAQTVLEHVRMIDKNAHPLVFEKNANEMPIISDKKVLEQILVNLMTNACKYSQPNEEVLLTIDLEEDKYVMKIRDYGVGIPPEEQTRVFEPFFRGSNSSGATGTGLGLSIVKRSCDLLGGTISVESELGSGSTFTIILPAVTKD